MDVERVPWPDGADRRAALRRCGLPRLLLVREQADPPSDIDILEDWVRIGANPIDIDARATSLARRAERWPPGPYVDGDDLLHHGRELVLLSPLEARITHLLVDNIGGVVAHATIARAGWPATDPAVKTVAVTMGRVRDRLASIGLGLVAVPRLGWLLERPASSRVSLASGKENTAVTGT